MYIGSHTCMSGYVSAYHGVGKLCILLHTILCHAVYISYEDLGVEVDPLGKVHVGEKLVVKRLYLVGVSTLEEQIYIHERDMYYPCCIQDGMNQPLCR